MGNGTSSLCLQTLAFPLPINETTCAPGFLCPNLDPNDWLTYPAICPPTIPCQLLRLGSQYCDAQGYFEPTLCPPGFYCPVTNISIPCDSGTYCPRGSNMYKDCGPFTMCPEQTEMRRFYGGILFSILIDLFMFGMYLWLRYYAEPAAWKKRQEKHLNKINGGGNGGNFEMLELGSALTSSNFSSSLPPSSSRAILEEGFRQCNAGMRIDLRFEKLTLSLPPPISKTILSNVSGRIHPGRVTAIMGPSGAGKTTFLSVLMGKAQRTSGSLLINGKPDEMFRYRRVTGFVPQDDTMIAELTVRENILFSARCRLPRSSEWTDEKIQVHVDAVIDVLGLRECADTLSSSVSGGQRKRTNIGMELAMAPAAIFLDEPTSGLDATAALEVCSTLKAIADLGLTVTAVIHQPRLEIFETFDDLLLLAPGGLTVYMGPQKQVIDYFLSMGFRFLEGHNPADDLLDFVAGKGKGCIDEAAIEALENELPHESLSSPSGFRSVNSDMDITRLDISNSSNNTPVKPSFISRFVKATESNESVISALMEAWRDPDEALINNYKEGLDAGLLSPKAQESNATERNKTKAVAKLLAKRWRSIGKQEKGDDSDSSVTLPASSVQEFDINAISESRGATFLRQCILVHNRSVLQQYRQAPSYALEVGVGMLAGGIMGGAATAVSTLYVGVLKPPYTLISPSPIEILLPSIGLYVALAVALAGTPAGVRTFGEEKNIFYREAASGHNKGAYYFAKTVSVIYRFTSGAFHFASVFHFLAKPSILFSTFFGIVWLQYYAVYGLASVTSMLVERENSALLGVIVGLIAACMCGFGPNLNQGLKWGIRWVQDISYARWANEAFFHAETLLYRDLFLVEDVSAPLFGYTLDRLPFDVGMILLIGAAYRVIAYFLLIGLNRNKQR